MTTLKWVSVCAVVLVVFAGVGWFIKDYVNTTKRAEQAEADYQTAKLANKKNELTIASMRKDYDNLQEDLKAWKLGTKMANEKLTTSQKRIKQLERENVELRAQLDIVIDCRVWLQLWPNSRRDDCRGHTEAAKH